MSWARKVGAAGRGRMPLRPTEPGWAQAAHRAVLTEAAEARAQADAARSEPPHCVPAARHGARRCGAASTLAEARCRPAVMPRPKLGACSQQALSRGARRFDRAEAELAALVPTREARRAAQLPPPSAWPPSAREQLAAEELRLRETRGAAARLAERRAACERGGGAAGGASRRPSARRRIFGAVPARPTSAARQAELAAAEAALTARGRRSRSRPRGPGGSRARPQRGRRRAGATCGAPPMPWRPRSGCWRAWRPRRSPAVCSSAWRSRRS